nr:Ras-related protein RABA1f [Tanacetum cinerariifolium]
VTYENVEHWIKEVKAHTDPGIVVMLVGNKADLGHLRAITTDDAKAFAERENFLFMEASARDALNVNNAFTELFTQIYRKARSTHATNTTPTKATNRKESGATCTNSSLGRRRDKEDASQSNTRGKQARQILDTYELFQQMNPK